MKNAEHHVARLLGNGHMANPRVAVIPKPLLLRPKLSDLQQRTETSTFQRVNQPARILACAQTGDDQRNFASRRRLVTPGRGSEWGTVTLPFPRMSLLSADG